MPGEPVPAEAASTPSIISCLYGWSAKISRPSPDRVFLADESLVFGNDLAHGRFDAGQVVVSEMGPPGKLEVVIKTVLDRRPDGVLRPGQSLVTAWAITWAVECRRISRPGPTPP